MKVLRCFYMLLFLAGLLEIVSTAQAQEHQHQHPAGDVQQLGQVMVFYVLHTGSPGGLQPCCGDAAFLLVSKVGKSVRINYAEGSELRHGVLGNCHEPFSSAVE